MAFNAYQDYLDQQRRQRRWERIIPIFVVAILLALMAIAFHGAYVRSHAKPKPSAEVTFYDVQTSGFEPGHAIGNPGTVWIKCNAGMDVTDLRDCPEYQNEGAYLAYIAAQARKHKRKARQWNFMPKFQLVPSPYDWNWHIVSTVPSEMWCEKPKGAKAVNCDSRPLTPQELDMYKPVPPVNTIIDLRRQPVYDPSAETPPAGYVTTPQDITNLMEQIAPTKPHGVQMDPDDYPSLTTKPAKPDCRMPADIDVCPQTVDPKASHD